MTTPTDASAAPTAHHAAHHAAPTAHRTVHAPYRVAPGPHPAGRCVPRGARRRGV